jgi:hypothetical protein
MELILLGALLLPAVTLDEDGKLDVADAAFSLTFDNFGTIEGLNVIGYDEQGNPLDPLALGSRFVSDDKLAIEGEGAIRLGGDTSYLTVDLGGLSNFIGRRVEITLWQKPEGTRMQSYLYWYGGNVLSPDATYLGALTLQPTGNVTSDGWEEFTTGPFDFAWAGEAPPIILSLSDEQIPALYGGAGYDVDAHVLIDALALRDLGAAAVDPVECSLVTEASACGELGVCNYGVCVDGAIKLGAALHDDELRADYLDRRAFEVTMFEGGRAPLSKSVDVVAVMDTLKGETRANAFWPTLARAYDLLVDGHASAALMGYPQYLNGALCLNEGEADLIDGSIAPIVFDAADNLIGASLEPGDVLTAIDGLPVADWVALASRMIGHSGDPAGKSVVSTPYIVNAALDTGAVLTFTRCTAVGACEDIDVDLGALTGDMLLNGESPTHLSFNSPDAYASCDYRFKRGVDAPNVRNYEFAGSATDEDNVRHLLINGVPGYYMQGGEEWFNAVEAALNDAPAQVVLDERTGGGGGIDAVDFLAGMLLNPNETFAMDFLPGFEGDDLTSAREAIVACSSTNNQGFGCGNGFRWRLGDAGGTVGAAGNAKLAILIALDVSGNDYLTRLMRERTAETRIFGAGATYGAFGVIWQMPAHIGELSGGSLQVQDTIFVDSETDDNTFFHTSTGIRPDEIVRQKQSDAVNGVDTVLAAAKAWLQQE